MRKDVKIKERRLISYMNKIYSPTPNCWFHDLIDQGANHTPRYWHLFVGVNTRYMYALPLNSKSSSDVKQTLTKFIDEFHPKKLTSDEESAFTSKEIVKFCTGHKVQLFIVTDKNHSTLGVIDRAIRTLRDMNVPRKYNQQSRDPQFQFFSEPKMKSLVKEYNNHKISTLGFTPNEMINDVNKEKAFILHMQEIDNKRHSLKNFKLKIGDYVRYRINKEPLTKHRFNYSFESYKIDSLDGKNYVLIAKDGTVKTFPRWKLIRADVRVYPHAKTFGGWNGVIDKIKSYDSRTNKYDVVFKLPDGSEYNDTIPASFLRNHTPQVRSKIENEFFARRLSST